MNNNKHKQWNSRWHRQEKRQKENRQFHIGRGLFRIAFFFLCLAAGISFLKELFLGLQKMEKTENHLLQNWVEQSIMEVWLPSAALLSEKNVPCQGDIANRLVIENFPVLLYSMEQPDKSSLQVQSESDYENLLLLEGTDEDNKGIAQEDLEYGEDAIHLDQNLENALIAENGFLSENKAAGGESGGTEEDSSMEENGEMTQNGLSEEQLAQAKVFHEVEDPLYRYQWENLQSYEELVKAFYAVDSTTKAGEELLHVETLRQKDMRLLGSNDNPQILIYHTHSQEAFADSIAGDESTTIVGAGEKLADLLRNKYGYYVLHDTESFDKESRDYAYTNALPAIEQLLLENPSIEVVIDLHRDALPEDRRLVVDLQGRPTAQFMFFNGLSRKRNGEAIASLENPNLEENLAFSFQMQAASNEYYPGIARRIYLKAYRYNMHLRGKYLLIELGAQNNTVEEIMNAIDPLAHVLHLVLSGNAE